MYSFAHCYRQATASRPNESVRPITRPVRPVGGTNRIDRLQQVDGLVANGHGDGVERRTAARSRRANAVTALEARAVFVTHQVVVADDRAGAGIESNRRPVRTRVSPRGHLVARSSEDQFGSPIPGPSLAPKRSVRRNGRERSDASGSSLAAADRPGAISSVSSAPSVASVSSLLEPPFPRRR